MKVTGDGVSYLQQHVFLAGGQVHLVLIVIHTDVDNVSQQLLITRDHLQLLVQTLHKHHTKHDTLLHAFIADARDKLAEVVPV